jgi:hypothetical protein
VARVAVGGGSAHIFRQFSKCSYPDPTLRRSSATV